MSLAADGASAQSVNQNAATAVAAWLIDDAQILLKQRKFAAALAKYTTAYQVVERIAQPEQRLYYRALLQLGMATDLGGLRRYPEALQHADSALAAINDPLNAAAPAALKAMVHHARGAILYSLGRPDEARAMFDLAASEGDADSAAWLRTIAGKGAAPEAIGANTRGAKIALSVQGLYQTCKAPDGATDASPCLEYIAGIADQMVLISALRTTLHPDSWRLVSSRAICNAPSYGAMRQSFINWAEKHPESWSRARSTGVIEALYETWSCTATKPK